MRRVVVTGIGLICAVGNKTEEIWQNLLAGKSGIGPITQFDASRHACRIAAEVKNFEPLNFIEKKEVKKMGRFIHLAMAAAQEAMCMSGLQITPENAENVGVHIGSGIGGFDIIEREHTALMEGGPRKISPFFIPAAIVNLAAGHVSIEIWSQGPERGHGYCLHDQRTLHWRFVPHYSARRCRRHDCRRNRGGNHSTRVGGFAAMRALSPAMRNLRNPAVHGTAIAMVS